MSVTVGQFGERRDPQQTLLKVLADAAELETVVVIKLFKDRTVNVSWSDADKITLLGMTELCRAQIREWGL